ncbi:MAG: nickel pincer cofactor biosynthesis protein LarC [Pseudomonadota bacterium]
MTIAYFDCFSGVSGDMVLGSMVDAGLPLSHLKKQLRLLPIGSYDLTSAKARRTICGTDIRVAVKSGPRSDGYAGLDRLIARSRLAKPVKVLARAIFARLARAEAHVHGILLSRVHFHEVGAVDSVVDVVGAAIGFDYFGFDAVYSSPLPMSRGLVRCEHGTFPVPAPATIELLKGIPLEPSHVKGEIVTPTGAAIIATVAEHFGECPIQKVERVGYGFGDRIIPGTPNALRLMIGDGFPVVVVQCDIDDMNPQIFDHVAKRLFAVGAVDVDLAAIQMKKGRPGVRLTALVPWEKKDAVIDIILKETTTFGVRYWPAERRVLSRELVQKKTRIGKMRFKIGMDASGCAVKVMPEYEDVVKLAKKKRRPLIEVHMEALAAAQSLIGRGR